MARPVKYTPDRQQRVLEAITAGATRRAAALHAGIDEATLRNWVKRYFGFSELLARAEADVELRCTALILRAAELDARHAEWWLERRRPDDFARRDRIDLEVYVRQRAHELGIDEAEAIEMIRPQLKALAG
jgi:transposase-like protein